MTFTDPKMAQRRFAEPKATSWQCRAAVYLLEQGWRTPVPTRTTQLTYNVVLQLLLYKDYGIRTFAAGKLMRSACGSCNKFVTRFF